MGRSHRARSIHAPQASRKSIPYPANSNAARKKPLDADILIVDEFSMVDTWLCAQGSSAPFRQDEPRHHRRQDQLPSVGPGNILRDLLRCRYIPGIRLTHFRQSGGNDIAEKAHKINEGTGPRPSKGRISISAIFRPRKNASVFCRELVLTGVKGNIDRHFAITGAHPDAQGRSAQMPSTTFCRSFSTRKPADSLCSGRAGKSATGDAAQNNYEKEVFNGDVGTVKKSRRKTSSSEVDFDGRNIPFSGLELDQMSLAYACTIHKSQGSEYPAVIIIPFLALPHAPAEPDLHRGHPRERPRMGAFEPRLLRYRRAGTTAPCAATRCSRRVFHRAQGHPRRKCKRMIRMNSWTS